MSEKNVYSFPSAERVTLPEVGGKGLSLMIGSQEGLPVPQGFILSVAFFKSWSMQLKTTEAWTSFLKADKNELEHTCDALKREALQLSLTDEQHNELSDNLKRFDQKTLFAVRSSSPEEDLEGTSFAGGYETVLGVTPDNIEEAIEKAFASCLDYRVAVYKQENGLDTTDPRIAVIVQQQIGSDVAGVGFSLNPVTNSYDDAVINANWGLGETVVAGTATPDTYVVDKISLKIKNKSCGAKETSIWLMPSGGTEERADERHALFALSDDNIVELTKLIAQVEQSYKKPIDIEWAYAKGELYLLQARPITAYVPLSPSMITTPGARKRLYLDVSTSFEALYQPLSVAGTSLFSVLIQKVGKMVFFRDITNDINTAIPWIAPGKMYVNVSNLFNLIDQKRLANFLTILDTLAAQTIRSVGEREYLSGTSLLKLLPFGVITKAPRVALQMVRARWWPEGTHRECQQKIRAFEEKARALAKKEWSSVLLAGTLFKSLFNDVIWHEAPLFIAGTMALAKMKTIAGKDLADKFGSFEVALPNNVTTEMGLALCDISELLPKSLSAAEIGAGIIHNNLSPAFTSAWKKFIDEYGHRGPREIDVAAPRYRDDPALLIDTLLSMQENAKNNNMREKFARNQEDRRKDYEYSLGEIKRTSPAEAKRFKSNYATFETFAGYRETHKFYLVFVIDLVRQHILKNAHKLYSAGRLQSVERIFDLTLDEIDGAMKNPSLDLAGRAKQNRKFIDRLARVRRMPSVIDSRGLILRPPMPPVRKSEVAGTPVSPGVVRGRVKVLHSPSEKPFLKGEILVARATDPGWTPLFANAAALVLDVGGVLQHGALVAREYGLPCVVGIENATNLWKDGTLIEVDGSTGIVRLMPGSE
jgi:phosphohistidine swiveling domain-containing protein